MNTSSGTHINIWAVNTAVTQDYVHKYSMAATEAWKNNTRVGQSVATGSLFSDPGHSLNNICRGHPTYVIEMSPALCHFWDIASDNRPHVE